MTLIFEGSDKFEKKTKYFLQYCSLTLLFVFLIGCSSKTEKNSQANYTVVKMSDGTSVNDLFEFESVSKIALDITMSDMYSEDGCYCIGLLQNGNSVVWKSDDDNYDYDDCMFIYVEEKVSDTQITLYAEKRRETPISYEEFYSMSIAYL